MTRRLRTLVTGGAGFIGAHLCRRLLGDGRHVICVDNFSSGARRHIEPLLERDDFDFIEHDVCTPLTLDVDEIYNLACPASPVQYQKEPVQTIRTNVLGMINMLDLAHRCGAKILQASTSEVYGDPLVHPQTEDYWGTVNPIGPRACYDEGKRSAETLCFDYRRQFGVRIKVARIFNTYGPMMRPNDGRVVPAFILQALAGEDITIFGDGRQTRAFCFVSDMVDGLVRLMATPDEVTGPINLGNPVEHTIEALARRIIGLVGSDSNLTLSPAPVDDPRQRLPDISRARAVLSWSPHVDLDAGLAQTIAYFRE